MAKSRANPVRARSPPDISDTACRRLPRGCAISSTPVSRGSPPSSASTSRSSARPPSKRRWKISPKWRLISSNAWANRSCAVRVMPQRLFQVLDRRHQVVVLGPEEREALVELAILLVGHEVDGADGGQLGVELADALAGGGEIARRIVQRQQRRRVDAISAPRLLSELLPAHAALRRPQLDVVDGGDRARQLALPAAQIALDRRQLVEQRLVALTGAARLLLEPVALDRHVARAHVRALPFLAQPLAPLAELGLPSLRLSHALG